MRKMKQTSGNPFYGQAELLSLFRESSTMKIDKIGLTRLLTRAWDTAKENKQLRQLFFVILFNYMGITNRHHNILKSMKKVDNGGEAWRDGTEWTLQWMRINTPAQYYVFLFKDIIRQFTGLLSILISRVKTVKKKTTVVEVINTIDEHDLPKLAQYLAQIISQANPVERILIAKALVRPKISRRQKLNKEGEKVGKRDLQTATLKNMRSREKLYTLLSDIMNWDYVMYPNNTLFLGMYAWKKEYNGTLESVLFSSGKIVEFDHDQFFKWLDETPAKARTRVRRRLLTKDNILKGKWKSKYGDADLGMWFLEWETYKESKQEEERVLVEKVRTGKATTEEVIQLEKVKKEAKVTVGASNIKDEMEKLLSGANTPKEADILIHSIMNKIDLQVPVLLCADISGSMGFNDRIVKTDNGNFYPYQAARLITTMLMLKNPSEDLNNYLVTFGTEANFITDGSFGIDKVNKFMQGKLTQVEKLIDRTRKFSENYDAISKFVHSDGRGTNISSIASKIKQWVDASESTSEMLLKKEAIQSYPVFLIISDGDFNNSYSAKSSLMQFKQQMLQWFGWEGAMVLWDISTKALNKDKFSDIENFFYMPGWNIGTINTIFSKLHDLDIIDIYTPLKSLFESNRTEIVKKYTL